MSRKLFPCHSFSLAYCSFLSQKLTISSSFLFTLVIIPFVDIAQYYTHQPVIIKWDEFNEGFTDLVYVPESQWQAECIFGRCSKKRDPELSIVTQTLIGHFYLQDTLWR
ncbi:hypothetical protein QE443_002744 [Pantoea ananatis]|jgi:hypothetical protein|nr:hypothetical protein [Pantoea ananatis]MDR6088461.1 hypothetical protein [Pantoea ananatis]PWV69525.1 hypothetical protein C7425_101440 [Pantoea ananatis]